MLSPHRMLGPDHDDIEVDSITCVKLSIVHDRSMGAFFASLGLNLRRLFDFSGRETQIQFWPYAIAVYALATLASMSRSRYCRS